MRPSLRQSHSNFELHTMVILKLMVAFPVAVAVSHMFGAASRRVLHLRLSLLGARGLLVAKSRAAMFLRITVKTIQY